MNLFEKKLSINQVLEIHKDVSFIEDFLNISLLIKDLNLLDYSSLGRTFCAFLAENNLPHHYKKFVAEYNKTILKEFSHDNSIINDILLIDGFPGYVLKDSFFIKDQTDIFLNSGFERESSLETFIYSGLLDYTDEWSVKRQRAVGSGICDLTVEFKDEKVAIELKRGTALPRDVMQAYGYQSNNSGFNPILIAKQFNNNALKLAKELDISCYEYRFVCPRLPDLPEFFVLNKVNEATTETIIHEELEEVDSCGGYIITYFEKVDYINEFNMSVEKNEGLINTLLNIIRSNNPRGFKTMNEIENKLVVDSQWRHFEKPERKEVYECAGCEEPIFAGEDYYEIRCLSTNEIIQVHQHASCCMQFLSEMAWCKTAE